MTVLGERIREFLESQPDVSIVRDASTQAYGDAITCCVDGSYWMIAIDRGTGTHIPEDPREKADR